MFKLTKEISSIDFGVYSPEEIEKMAVVEITNSKLNGLNSVYDERMGKLKNSQGVCDTCKLSGKYCPGHFGYIELVEPILNPLFYKVIILFLKCICINCNKLLFTYDKLRLNNLDKCPKATRLKKIVALTEKYERCPSGCVQPKYIFNKIEYLIAAIYTDTQKKEKYTLNLDVSAIHNLFCSFTDSDIELFGLNPKLFHPKNLIIHNLLVIPPCCRPSLSVNGDISDDDLTNQYNEIVKINNQLKNAVPERRQKLIQTLKFKISTLFNNSAGKSKYQTNGRAIKGFKERISSKAGLIRENCSGKRVNHCSRSVIGADPTLRIGEMAIPYEVSRILTIPEKATAFNIHILQEYVNNGKAHLIAREDPIKEDGVAKINVEYATRKKGTSVIYGDVIIRNGKEIKMLSKNGKDAKGKKFELKNGDRLFRNGKEIENLVYPTKTELKLKIGDVVDRYLKDGDIVLLNRQPTLHSGSMLGIKIKVRRYRSFRFGLAICKSLNADRY